MLRWLWLSGLVIGLDQLTKQWMADWLQPYEVRPVIDGFFNLTLTFNPGAAFSFLATAGGWQRWLFSILALAVVTLLVVWLARLQAGERLTAVALSLVIGGAVGNLIDRLRHGHVIDFLDFYLGDWHWPAFNVADSTIFLGVAFLLLAGFFSRPD